MSRNFYEERIAELKAERDRALRERDHARDLACRLEEELAMERSHLSLCALEEVTAHTYEEPSC